MTGHRQRYECIYCQVGRLLPEGPEPPQYVRCGCELCGRITRHTAVGTAEYAEWVARGGLDG